MTINLLGELKYNFVSYNKNYVTKNVSVHRLCDVICLVYTYESGVLYFPMYSFACDLYVLTRSAISVF